MGTSLHSRNQQPAYWEEGASVINGSSVPLVQWLQVSWFYPNGFVPEKIIETNSSYLVVGSDVVYKFVKDHQADRGKSSVALAIEEVLDGIELAPGLYLGVEGLSWDQDELNWTRSLLLSELERAKSETIDCDLAAIVMRRLPTESSVAEQLRRGKKPSPEANEHIAAVLSGFHRQNRIDYGTPIRPERKTMLSSLRKRSLDVVKEFSRGAGCFLDPYSQIALQEITNFLNLFFAKQEAELLNRFESNFMVDGHGALAIDRIYISPFSSKGICLLGRKPRHNGERISDLLFDVASVVVDLEEAGATCLAKQFEDSYFSAYPEAKAEGLYQFYLCQNALQRAIGLYEGSEADDLHKANRYLSWAFRYAMGLREPFVLALSAPLADELGDLAQDIADFVGGTLISVPETPSESPHFFEPDEAVFERLLAQTRRAVREGQSAILVWPLRREEERYSVAKLAHEFDVRYLLVKCMLSDAEKIRRSLASGGDRMVEARSPQVGGSYPWNDSLSTELRQLIIEPVLPPAELSLYILQELKRRKQRLSCFSAPAARFVP